MIAAFAMIQSQSRVLSLAFRVSGRPSRLLSTRRFSGTADNASSGEPTASQQTDDDPLAIYRNRNNIRDQVFSAMSGDGGIKVTAVTVRNMVNDLMIQHTMTETPSEALGRTVICGLLMANGVQDEQVVQITMNGELAWVV